ncbi:MAG TPA: hypothetical protein PLP29_14430 [Candidatus Ozemobacteraceae bacterium]|nr:hypothetical protein [Candidatus Ozemobacteraceae bacterium]
MRALVLVLCVLVSATAYAGGFSSFWKKNVEQPWKKEVLGKKDKKPTPASPAPAPAPVVTPQAPAANQPQQFTPHQQKAIDSIVGFYRRFEGESAATELRSRFDTGKIRVGPVEDNDNADTNVDTKVITLNEKMAEEVITGSSRSQDPGTEDFKATADWAATIKHEYVHAGQKASLITRSTAQWEMTGTGYPSEVEGWQAGFQSYLTWLSMVRGKLNSNLESEREDAAAEVKDLCEGFLNYRQNYNTRYGAIALTSCEQDKDRVTLDEAAREVEDLKASAERILDRTGFKVFTNPRVCNPQEGQVYELKASLRGREAKDILHYRWYVDGVRMEPTGPVFRRTAKKTESVRLEVTDSFCSKRDYTCHVTVKPKADEPKTEQPRSAAPAGGSVNGVAEWGCHHIKYTISGAELVTPPTLTSPKFWDVYSYSGKVHHVGIVTISGSAISDNPSNSEAFYYGIEVSLTIGKNTKTFSYKAPPGEKLNKPFNLSVAIPEGAVGGTFNMTLTQVNPLYGNRGVAVEGNLTVQRD